MEWGSIQSRELTRAEFEAHLKSHTPQESRELRGVEAKSQPAPLEVRSREHTRAEFEAHLSGRTPEESRLRVMEVSRRMVQGADVLMTMDEENAGAVSAPMAGIPTLASFPRLALKK